MAVDTREKRASVIGLGRAGRVVLPVPDATVGQADRAQTSWCYAGISAALVFLVPILRVTRIQSRAVIRTLSV